MAESKGSLIAKSVQKHAGRAKEKVCHKKKFNFRESWVFFSPHFYSKKLFMDSVNTPK